MSRDPKQSDLPSVGASSDDEFLRALHRVDRSELPSETKMQELADRLGPMLVTKSVTAGFPWRTIRLVALAGAIVVGAIAFRQHLSARERTAVAVSVQPSAPVVVAPQVVAADPPREVTAPVVSVDSLPPASVPSARQHAEPVCSDELELVERADAALRGGNARVALDLTREHSERCPRGAFVQERERIAIEALASLGRTSEVRARARSFEQRFPTSPHVWRIRKLAEGEAE